MLNIILIARYLFLIAPSGTVNIEPSSHKKHAGEEAILRCHIQDKGNPPCDKFIWKRLGLSDEATIKGKNTLELYVDESDTGNYICKCSNEHGESHWSVDHCEVVLLEGDPSSSPLCKILFIFIELNRIIILRKMDAFLGGLAHVKRPPPGQMFLIFLPSFSVVTNLDLHTKFTHTRGFSKYTKLALLVTRRVA